MQLSLLRAKKQVHICIENVQINSKNVTGIHNGSFWVLSSKTISEMDSSNVNITYVQTCKYFSKDVQCSNGSQENV